MRVLLISSYTLSEVSRTDIAPPLSLLYIAGVIRNAGHEVIICDLTPVKVPPGVKRERCYLDYIALTIQKNMPDIVGQNCFLSSHFSFVRAVAHLTKNILPSVPFIIGGIHPTLFAEDILKNCCDIDVVIMGEGERQAVAVVESFAKNDKAALKNIPAIAYRDNSNNPVINKRVGFHEPLDSLPLPAWDLISVEDYYTDHSNWYNPKKLPITLSAPILTSRSCPYDCSFCSAKSMMGRGFRMHGPARVVDEMEYLYRKYGINYFGFVDDNLTLDKKHILRICNQIIRRGMEIQFESFNGYNIASMDEEIVAAMCEAGCVYVIMPIEHGSDYMRNTIIGKKLPREDIYTLACLYKKYRLLTRGVFIMGFPEETEETLTETLQMMYDLELDMYNVFTLIPFPGTKVFEQALRDNLFLQQIDRSKLWKGDLQLDTLRSSYFIKPYNLSTDRLDRFREKFDALRFNSSFVKSINKKTLAA